MSEESNIIPVFGGPKKNFDAQTGLPVEVQEALDAEIPDILDQIKQLHAEGKINALCLTAFHDGSPMEVTVTTARVWGSPTRALGLLVLHQTEIATTVRAAVAAAEYEDD